MIRIVVSVLSLALMAGLLSAPAMARPPSDFCDRKPDHHHCATPAPTPTPSPTPSPTPTVTPTPSTSAIAMGAYIHGAPWDESEIDRFTDLVGVQPAVVMWYQDWATAKSFDPAFVESVRSRGAMPMISWEPWDYRGGADQPEFSLDTITNGEHDSHIRSWAESIAQWGHPLYLRFAHEMNGDWYSWGVGVNGNEDGDYVRAWRHVFDMFAQEGATNVRWVWSPNIGYSEQSSQFESFYPGDSYVHWTGLDGYNWGTTVEWHTWQSFTDVFAASYDAIVSLSPHPLMIAETASTEEGGDKAAWIDSAFLTEIPNRFPLVRAVVWFNENKETDWRVNSSESALFAYRRAADSPYYSGLLP